MSYEVIVQQENRLAIIHNSVVVRGYEIHETICLFGIKSRIAKKFNCIAAV